MSRCLAAATALLLCALPAAAAAPRPCEFKESRNPLKLEGLSWKGAHLEGEVNSTWFYCVRQKLKAEAKAAGRATPKSDGVDYPQVRFTWTDAKGQEHRHEAGPMDSNRLYETVGFDQLCADGPGPKTVKAALEVPPAWAPLAFEGGPVTLYCYRCEDFPSSDNSLAMIPERGGDFTFRATVDKGWHACAVKDSTLELWMFAAPTRLEARELKEPTHKVQGLERSPRMERRIPTAALCKGGNQFVGYELHGTGDMTRLNGQRGVSELRCK